MAIWHRIIQKRIFQLQHNEHTTAVKLESELDLILGTQRMLAGAIHRGKVMHHKAAKERATLARAANKQEYKMH